MSIPCPEGILLTALEPGPTSPHLQPEPGAKGNTVVCLPGETRSTLQLLHISVRNLPPPPSRESTYVISLHFRPWLTALLGHDCRGICSLSCSNQAPCSAPQGTTTSLCHQLGSFFPINSSHPKCLTPRSDWSQPPEHAQDIPFLNEQKAPLNIRAWPLLGLITIHSSIPRFWAKGRQGSLRSHTSQIRIYGWCITFWWLLIQKQNTEDWSWERERKSNSLKILGNLEESYQTINAWQK